MTLHGARTPGEVDRYVVNLTAAVEAFRHRVTRLADALPDPYPWEAPEDQRAELLDAALTLDRLEHELRLTVADRAHVERSVGF